MTSKPILCELYDYIEIACTFRYPVLLILDNGNEAKGIAVDTLTKTDKTEHILLQEQTNEILEVPLNELVQMKALVANPILTALALSQDSY